MIIQKYYWVSIYTQLNANRCSTPLTLMISRTVLQQRQRNSARMGHRSPYNSDMKRLNPDCFLGDLVGGIFISYFVKMSFFFPLHTFRSVGNSSQSSADTSTDTSLFRNMFRMQGKQTEPTTKLHSKNTYNPVEINDVHCSAQWRRAPFLPYRFALSLAAQKNRLKGACPSRKRGRVRPGFKSLVGVPWHSDLTKAYLFVESHFAIVSILINSEMILLIIYF